MKITEGGESHVLLQPCTHTFTAVVLGAFCLTIWGLMFPMTLVAQAATLPPSWTPSTTISSRLPPPRGPMDGQSPTGTHPIMMQGRPDSAMFKPPSGTPEHAAVKMVLAKPKQIQPLQANVKSINANIKALQKQFDALTKSGVTLPSGVSDNMTAATQALNALAKALADNKPPTGTPMRSTTNTPPTGTPPMAPPTDQPLGQDIAPPAPEL